MRLSIWQFVGLILLVVLIWFIIYTWMPGQDQGSWIDKMNSWFMKAEPEGTE